MRLNQIKVGSFISYAQIAAGIVVGLLYTPLMIRLLGHSEYGLYNTASSIISMLSVLSLGFNSGYIRFFTKYKSEHNEQKIHRLNGMYLLIFAVIGIVALLCGLYLSAHLDIVFGSGLTDEEYKLARRLMVLLTVNLAISFPMSVFSNIISANERFVFLKSLGLLKTVVSPLISLPLLLLGFKSTALAVATIAIALITDVMYLYYVLFVLNNKFVFHHFEHSVFRELFVFTSFIAINIIVDQINWNVDKLLLARYKGTTAVAVYSVGYTLFSYYMVFSTAISGLFTPRVHKIVHNDSDDAAKQLELSAILIKVGRIQFMVLGLISSGLCFFGHEFIIRIWAGEGYSESYYVMIILVLASTIALIQNVGIEIQRALNLHKFRSVVYVIMAAGNLSASIVLCQKFGAVGSAIGTGISLILCNGIIMNIYYSRKCKLDIVLFWKNIVAVMRGLIPPVILASLLGLVQNESLLVWLSKIVIYGVVYCLSMWCFAMNQYEKALLKKPMAVFAAKIRKVGS